MSKDIIREWRYLCTSGSSGYCSSCSSAASDCESMVRTRWNKESVRYGCILHANQVTESSKPDLACSGPMRGSMERQTSGRERGQTRSKFKQRRHTVDCEQLHIKYKDNRTDNHVQVAVSVQQHNDGKRALPAMAPSPAARTREQRWCLPDTLSCPEP